MKTKNYIVDVKKLLLGLAGILAGSGFVELVPERYKPYAVGVALVALLIVNSPVSKTPEAYVADLIKSIQTVFPVLSLEQQAEALKLIALLNTVEPVIAKVKLEVPAEPEPVVTASIT